MCRKELKDWSRDRRSIITVLVSSLLAPVHHRLHVQQHRQPRSAQVEDVTIPVVGARARAGADGLAAAAGRRRRSSTARPIRKKRCARGSEDVVVVIAEDFAKNFTASQPAQIRLVADSSSQNSRPKVQRVRGLLQRYSSEIGSLRLIARGVSPVGRHARCRSKTSRCRARSSAPRTILGFIPLFIMISAFTGGDADRHRLDRRRARARLDRGAAGQSGAARGDRRGQVAGRHAHRRC